MEGVSWELMKTGIDLVWRPGGRGGFVAIGVGLGMVFEHIDRYELSGFSAFVVLRTRTCGTILGRV
jgi:hypothetical protein